MKKIPATIFAKQQPNGSPTWCLEITVGKDPEGKRRRRRFAVSSQLEGQKLLAEIEQNYRPETLETIDRIGPTELVEAYVATKSKYGLKESTRADYLYRLDRYVSPYLGSKSMDQLSDGDFQLWVDELGHRNYAFNTIRNTVRLLSAAFDWGIHKGLVSRNLVSSLEFGKAPQDSWKATWDASTVARALNLAGNSRIGVFLGLALLLALRKGEILGLKWSDIDFVQGTLTVNSTLYSLTDPRSDSGRTKLTLTSPKSESSRRVLPLTPELKEALFEWQTALMWESSLAKRVLPEWVFPTKNSTPLAPSNLASELKRFLEAHNLPRLNPHALRKTGLVLAMQGGASIEAVSQFAGHTSINLTKQVYAKFVPGFNEASAYGISKAIEEARNEL